VREIPILLLTQRWSFFSFSVFNGSPHCQSFFRSHPSIGLAFQRRQCVSCTIRVAGTTPLSPRSFGRSMRSFSVPKWNCGEDMAFSSPPQSGWSFQRFSFCCLNDLFICSLLGGSSSFLFPPLPFPASRTLPDR